MSDAPKLITIIGATGIQGGSVIKALVNNPAYTLRAVTSNSQSEAANALRNQGIDVVEIKSQEVASYEAAFTGSYAIFASTNHFKDFMTTPTSELIRREAEEGINMAKAAANTPTLEHYIWSTLPHVQNISGGKYMVPHWTSKNHVDDYIRSDAALFSKTTFLWISFYASNILYPFWKPFPLPQKGPNHFIRIMSIPASTPIKFTGDVSTNIGLFAKGVFEHSELTRGRFVLLETESMTAGEWLDLWGVVHGKTVDYVEVDEETIGRLFPGWGQGMHSQFVFWNEFRDAWASEDVLTKEDLGIVGLVDTATAMRGMPLMGL
jgi:hypothetical protein